MYHTIAMFEIMQGLFRSSSIVHTICVSYEIHIYICVYLHDIYCIMNNVKKYSNVRMR